MKNCCVSNTSGYSVGGPSNGSGGEAIPGTYGYSVISPYSSDCIPQGLGNNQSGGGSKHRKSKGGGHCTKGGGHCTKGGSRRVNRRSGRGRSNRKSTRRSGRVNRRSNRRSGRVNRRSGRVARRSDRVNRRSGRVARRSDRVNRRSGRVNRR